MYFQYQFLPVLTRVTGVCWSLSQLSLVQGRVTLWTSDQLITEPHRDKQTQSTIHTPIHIRTYGQFWVCSLQIHFKCCLRASIVLLVEPIGKRVLDWFLIFRLSGGGIYCCELGEDLQWIFFLNAINIICIKMHLSSYLSHVTPSRLYGRLFTVIQEVIGKKFLGKWL